jgi:hypothetical protein
VDTPGTAAYQGDARTVPSNDDFIRAAQRIAREMPRELTHVYLATDDAHAEVAFRAAFGSRLCVRSGVQRVEGGYNPDGTLREVHIASSFNPTCTVSDAADVLCDALLLSRCGTVLHMDSNVTSTVGILNPTCEMRHVHDVLSHAS